MIQNANVILRYCGCGLWDVLCSEMKRDGLGTGMLPSWMDQWLRTSRLIWCLVTLPPSDGDKSSSQNVVFRFECKAIDKTQKASDDGVQHITVGTLWNSCCKSTCYIVQAADLYTEYLHISVYILCFVSCFHFLLHFFIFIPSSNFRHSYFRLINLVVLCLFWHRLELKLSPPPPVWHDSSPSDKIQSAQGAKTNYGMTRKHKH
jgi:hypothetical protein